MPILQSYHHGATAGVPPSSSPHQRAKRNTIGGWSYASTRSNTRFLYSVDGSGLTGTGWALSLTVRDCPPTHAEWHATRRAFLMRLQRMGMIRCHWLIEWQKRGVPHLHAAVWLPETSSPGDQRVAMTEAWLAVAEPYGAGIGGQHLAPISDAVGWFRYLSKHAARGVSHYQRSPEAIPVGWKKTGRMWGHLGDWPISPPDRWVVTAWAFWIYRRRVRAYRLADARRALASAPTPAAARQARQRIVQARRMLRCRHRNRSEVLGVSEWMPQQSQNQLLLWLAAEGFEVRREPEPVNGAEGGEANH